MKFMNQKSQKTVWQANLITFFVLQALLILNLQSCSSEKQQTPTSNLATVSVGSVKNVDYDSYKLSILETDANGEYLDSEYNLIEKTYPKDQAIANQAHVFRVGSFLRVSLGLLKDSVLIYSTEYCDETKSPFKVSANPSANVFKVRLCGQADSDLDPIETEPDEGRDITISPSIEDDQDPAPVPNPNDQGNPMGLSEPILGFYVLLADDSHEPYTSNFDWQPALHEYQRSGANTLFFTFIRPDTMQVPPAFEKLLATRGTGSKGSIPADTNVIYSIGGQAYSQSINPWPWLESREKAEQMAKVVATWNADGVDLDIEEGAGAHPKAGENLTHFVRKLKSIRPNMLVTLPVYGFPQIDATNYLVNASWDAQGKSQGLVDAIGIMVYEGAQSLNYVKNYASATSQWEGFPIRVNVPSNRIFVGAKGTISEQNLSALAKAVVQRDLGGVIVWYASVANAADGKQAIQYAVSWDASVLKDDIWMSARASWK